MSGTNPTDGWCPFAARFPTTKFWQGNDGRRAAVMHIAQGSYEAAVSWLTNATTNPNSSAHFMIAKDGRIAQMVSVNDSAWANGLGYENGQWFNPRGTPVKPAWQDLVPGVNPNRYTISVEHEGVYQEAWTPALYEANTRLLKWLAVQFSITYVPHRTLIGHYELDPVDRANCPGPTVNFIRIADDANGGVPTITSVAFAPTTLELGQLLNVSITVKNDAAATFATQGPDPGLVYNEGDTFASRAFPDVAGAYRVGIDFDGRVGIDHPYRWGLGAPLAPGQTRAVTGAIRLNSVQARNFWVGLAQEQIAWVQDQQGRQWVTVKPAPTQPPKGTQPTITSVTFDPTTLSAGQLLNVSITVRNDGNTVLETQSPAPGFVYNEGEDFRGRGFGDIDNAYRVGIDYDGRSGIDHPYRWGLGAPLAPGQSVTVTGALRLSNAQNKNYWAGLVREHVAWLKDRMGVQRIAVNAAPTPPPPPVPNPAPPPPAPNPVPPPQPSGGKPTITAVEFSPTTLEQGQLVKVSVTLKNNSNAALQTQGPDPNFIYNEGDDFLTKGQPALAGAYRIGVDYDGRAGADHPYRWGLGAALAPGQTTTVTGFMRLNRRQSARYWVALIQEQVGVAQDQQGVTSITVERV